MVNKHEKSGILLTTRSTFLSKRGALLTDYPEKIFLLRVCLMIYSDIWIFFTYFPIFRFENDAMEDCLVNNPLKNGHSVDHTVNISFKTANLLTAVLSRGIFFRIRPYMLSV